MEMVEEAATECASLLAGSMIDQFNLPPCGKADIQIFQRNESWSEWVRPRGRTMAYMFVIGSGGGGGGGYSNTAGGARGGGGGGGSGGFAKLVIPVMFLPEILFCYVPSGGLGGTPGLGGGGGNTTYISTGIGPAGTMTNTRANPQVILKSCETDATGGSAGSLVAAGNAGSGALITLQTNCLLSYCGFWWAAAGVNGSAGGGQGGAVGVNNNTLQANYPFSGGGGGAGTTSADFAGGSQQGSGRVPAILGGQTYPSWANSGGAGLTYTMPLIGQGGAGGASQNFGPGGQGGGGGLGSGGGGGGGGTVAGSGGQGGPGMAVIICW